MVQYFVGDEPRSVCYDSQHFRLESLDDSNVG